MHALINLGSTHSYVCIEHVFDKMIAVEQLSYDMHVINPVGHSVNMNIVYKNCHIIIHDREFFADLIALPFREFDLILGMNWLSKHRAIIDCDKKTISNPSPSSPSFKTHHKPTTLPFLNPNFPSIIPSIKEELQWEKKCLVVCFWVLCGSLLIVE